jgi:hypothetical protein
LSRGKLPRIANRSGCARGLHAELVRVRIPRRVRGEDGRIDTAAVHLLQGMFLEIGGICRCHGLVGLPAFQR